MDLKLRRPSNRVAKLVGIAMAILLCGVAIGSTLFRPQNQVQILVAKQNLPAGSIIEKNSVTQKAVPDWMAKNYLTKLPIDWILTTSIDAGAGIPTSQLTRNQNSSKVIRLNAIDPIASVIKVGDFVDVWAANVNSRQLASAPEPVALGAVVTNIERTSTLGTQSNNVELLVQEPYVESLLAATSAGNKIQLVTAQTLEDVP